MLFGIDYATCIIGIVALLIGIVVYKDLKNAKPNVYNQSNENQQATDIASGMSLMNTSIGNKLPTDW